MLQTIIDRYETNGDGRLIIDVAVQRVEELYDKFDIDANYKKKDLDEDFVQYLIDCVREIKRLRFLIRIRLSRPEPADNENRVRASIRHYFQYLQEGERREIRKHLTRSCYFLGLGIFLIFLSLSLTSRYAPMVNIFKELGIEGITIVAWVSMWEAISNLIFEWIPHLQRVRLYQRIIDCEVNFLPTAQPRPEGYGPRP